MSTIVTEIELINVDLETNANKVWRAKLFDTGDVISEWGRVGYSLSTTNYPSGGQAKFDSMVKSKIKKGYFETKTVKTDGTIQVVSEQKSISKIVSEQIALKSPTLNGLVSRLVAANVHNIISATSIKYDAKSGLFQTPLGVVTPNGITEAKNLLITLKDEYDKGVKAKGILGEYLRVIPHNYGMKLNVDNILTPKFFVEENDTLDALVASFDTMEQSTTKADAPKADVPKVFDVELDLLEDKREWDRLVKKYYDTRKHQHVCNSLKPINIYSLKINSVHQEFERKGKKLDPIKELWHGSRTANVLSILSKGLRVTPPNSVNKTGALFGRGLYFAIDSTKSLNYSYGYWDGSTKDKNCFMFVADVAMGKYYTPKYGESIPVGYDSLWARADHSGVRNDEIVIRNEHQCNLKYLMEFN